MRHMKAGLRRTCYLVIIAAILATTGFLAKANANAIAAPGFDDTSGGAYWRFHE